jgi:hypothetical protein
MENFILGTHGGPRNIILKTILTGKIEEKRTSSQTIHGFTTSGIGMIDPRCCLILYSDVQKRIRFTLS